MALDHTWIHHHDGLDYIIPDFPGWIDIRLMQNWLGENMLPGDIFLTTPAGCSRFRLRVRGAIPLIARLGAGWPTWPRLIQKPES
mgnify:CR=1 FL=1